QQTCKPLVSPLYGIVQCETIGGEMVCTAVCNHDHEFVTGEKVLHRNCFLNNGSYPDGTIFPRCVARSPCMPLYNQEHGRVNCVSEDTKLACSATCNDGYRFETGERVVQLQCDRTTDTWLKGSLIPACIPAKCEQSLMTDIPDTQINATSVWTGVRDYYFGPERARINSTAIQGDGKFLSGGWRPMINSVDQLIQVELNNVSRVDAIVTKGRNVVAGDSAKDYVLFFRVLYSLDGKIWQSYGDQSIGDKFLHGNTDNDTPVVNRFGCPFVARYVQINPVAWKDNIGLRFDLLGCPYTSHAGPCKEMNTTATTTMTTRTTPRLPELTTSTESPTTSSTYPSTTTNPPSPKCYPLSPPKNGIVSCEEQGGHLVCSSHCKSGYIFETGAVLLKRDCSGTTGRWTEGGVFPNCTARTNPTSTPSPHNSTVECLNIDIACSGVANGDYHACASCHFYATCSEGYLYIRACPENLIFDVARGQCLYTSSTCSKYNVHTTNS
ncbi:hypothetical protein ACJMK2_026761, partial [Sinanodonta woodiana]